MSARERHELAYLLDLAADGDLDAAEQVRLERLLESEPHRRAVASARQRSRRLVQTLDADREALRPSPQFRQQVMSALPAAGWEARSRRAWKIPVALLAVMLAAAALLLRAGAEATSSTLSVIGGVLDAAVTAALAGAGLLTATWRGLGVALGEVLGGSALEMVLFALGVVSLNVFVLLLVRRLRRARGRSTVAVGAEGDWRGPDSRR